MAAIDLWHPLSHGVVITGFVFVMMVVVEYLTVTTRTLWPGRGPAGRGQYAAGAALGAVPGCLGAFAAAAMHSRGVLSFGALLAAMITTVGDEAFLMLALFPARFAILTAILFAAGLLAGVIVDLAAGPRPDQPHAIVEPSAPGPVRPDLRAIAARWRRPVPIRAGLSAGLVVFGLAAAVGWLDSGHGGWIRMTTVITVLLGLAITITASDSFLIDNLYRHVLRRHAPRIMAWTSGALIVTELVAARVDLAAITSRTGSAVLAAACLLGLLPESGPQVLFITLFHRGAIPFAILLAGSIVQDGHGMLPILAHSRRTFVLVKAIKLAIGLAVGWLGLTMGW